MKKLLKYTTIHIAFITICCIVFFPAIKYHAEKSIYSMIDHAFQKSIATDYNNRIGKERTSSSGSHTYKKIKNMSIQTENGAEIFEFRDSIEIYKAIQLTNQYVLIQSNPLNPHDFNAVFKEELDKNRIKAKTGVIYYHNNTAHSSEEDLTSFSNAILSDKVFIDARETAAVQVWANCSFITYLAHTSPWLYILFCSTLAIGNFGIIYLMKRKKNISPIKANKDIHVDTEKKEIFISEEKLRTTPMTYSILKLLIENPDTYVHRCIIEKELWENPEKEDANVVGNRINQNISTLRNDLKPFPQYQIIYERGKGYKLTHISTASGTEGT